MKLKSLIEANPDGTISPEEEKKMLKLKTTLTAEVNTFNKKIAKIYKQADKIGGKFRGVGYRQQIQKHIRKILQVYEF